MSTDMEASPPLDLSGLAETATIQPADLAAALGLLSAPQPPSRIILPPSLLIRRRLARAGLVFAADRRNVEIEIEGEPVTVPEALGVTAIEPTLALAQYDLETSDRMCVISQLESRFRQPPAPNEEGRRYFWIDGLGVAPGDWGPRERRLFDRHADQCLFELVDNVHRWARSARALAVVSATSGGGERSFNRLQVVVIDDGIGIVDSAKEKAAAMADAGRDSECVCNEDSDDAEVAANVILDLLSSVYQHRRVAGARGGHGLHTVQQHVSHWDGTVNVISSFAPGRAMHLGRRGKTGRWSSSEIAVGGLQGTVVHLTLEAAKQETPRRSEMQRREPATV